MVYPSPTTYPSAETYPGVVPRDITVTAGPLTAEWSSKPVRSEWTCGPVTDRVRILEAA